jgi:hypothetical protein
MPKIKHPSTMPENLQQRISAPNVNSSHHSWSQGLQESYIRFACLSTLMKAFFVCLSFDRRVQHQKSKNPKIQKEKHSESVHKALAAMRHTKAGTRQNWLTFVDMKVCAHLSNGWVMYSAEMGSRNLIDAQSSLCKHPLATKYHEALRPARSWHHWKTVKKLSCWEVEQRKKQRSAKSKTTRL